MSDKTDELLSKREQTHGPAAETFNVGIQLINVVANHAKSKEEALIAHDFAIINILHKIARILCGSYNPDHWDDIEGYARLGKKIQEENNNGERKV